MEGTQKTNWTYEDIEKQSAPEIYAAILRTRKTVTHHPEIYANLIQARIIDFGGDSYYTCANTVQRLLLSKFPDFSHISSEEEFDKIDVTPDLKQKYRSWVNSQGGSIPLNTEFLPFDHVFFSFNTEVISDCRLLGYLVSFDGSVISYTAKHEGDKTFLEEYIEHSDVWADPGYLYSPWVINFFIGYLKEYRAFLTEHRPQKAPKGHRWLVKKPIPAPYYTVYIKSEFLEEFKKRQESTGITFQYQYRFDRRGHERCYVKTGLFPLDPAEHKHLVHCGYRIYLSLDNITGEDLERIKERNKQIQSNEWVAIKHRWIDADVIPHKPNLPYIPAIRKPSKKHRPETLEVQ